MLDVSQQIIEKPNLAKDFSQEIKELSDKINTISVEFKQILVQIDQAESRKAKAKTDYEKFLDRGLETEMSACLSTVRKMNQEKELLQSQLGDYPARVKDLYCEQRELVTAARGEVPGAETALKKAQDDLKFVQVQIDKAGHNLLSDLNQLNDTVNKNIKK